MPDQDKQLKIIYEPNFVAGSEQLFDTLVKGVAWDDRMRARKTANFGEPYNYSGMTYDAVPMHEMLVPIVDRLETRFGFRPNNCLLNYYVTGESAMGFHSDSNVDFAPGAGVSIISLGGVRSIVFRARRDKAEERRIILASGSLLYTPPEVQDEWKHAVPPDPLARPRISLTFRELRGVLNDR